MRISDWSSDVCSSDLAVEAKALLGTSFREMWSAKQAADGYAAGSGADTSSPKARMARTMQHFVDTFEATPVVALPCRASYRDPHPSAGASLYPTCPNPTLHARAPGYGGEITTRHSMRPGDQSGGKAWVIT